MLSERDDDTEEVNRTLSTSPLSYGVQSIHPELESYSRNVSC